MKHLNFLHNAVFRFRRFSRSGYAAFRSMHRVVNIGRLASYIADRQLKKSVALVALWFPFLCGTAMAQTDDQLEEHLLPTLDIVAAADSAQGSPDAVAVISRVQLQGLAVSSVGELLEQLPGLDLRTRGGSDVQGDLTMRGGTFDQMIVLLNGVNLNDAQTGHHNLDIPIDLSMVERVEIIPAAALVHYGLSSFCGAVNIVTGEVAANQLRAQMAGGSFGQAHLSAGGTRKVGRWTLSAAAAYHRSDGYMANTDYRHGSLYLQARRHGRVGDWLLQLGGQTKDFGSQAFYSLRYPDQYEATRTLVASATRKRYWHGWHLEGTLYGRLHKDRFELFREGMVEAPAWYGGHNYHLSSNAGLRLRASRRWMAGKTTFGTELREESILSSVLGDTLATPRPVYWEPEGHFYTLGKSRLNGNAFVEHSLFLRKVKLTAGLMGSYNTLMGPNYGYSLGAEYPIGPQWHLMGSAGRSFRLPTYTDLYYHSATQVSDPNLKPEVSHHAELTLRYSRQHFLAAATLYSRHGTNIIDWVRMPEETVWHSMNHATIDAMGGDLQAAYRGDGVLRRLGVGYSYCTMAQAADGYISNYVLDYLRHKVGIDLMLSPFCNFRVKLLADYHYRVGTYTDLQGKPQAYAPVLLFNGGLEYDLWQLTFFAEGYNLLNKEYCDYGGILQPGISIVGGVRLKM